MKRYRLSREALNDLDEIFIYWTERARAAVAQRLLERIASRFWLIAEHPHAGYPAAGVAPGVRCFPAGKYLIYYRKTPAAIEILHIFHGARDQQAAWKPSKT